MDDDQNAQGNAIDVSAAAIDKSSFPASSGSSSITAAVPDSISVVQPKEDGDVKDVAQGVSEGSNTQKSAKPSQLSSVPTPQYADDNDLIEKEWVNKAKHIIDKTKNDPRILSNELTLFKADYIKKRYNKTIKTGE